jgi:hypothetical protein
MLVKTLVVEILVKKKLVVGEKNMLEEYVKNVKNMNILYDRKKEIPVKNVPLQ